VERLEMVPANDIPFFLEFVGYEEARMKKASTMQEEPEIVIQSSESSRKIDYGVHR